MELEIVNAPTSEAIINESGFCLAKNILFIIAPLALQQELNEGYFCCHLPVSACLSVPALPLWLAGPSWRV
ncbi:hypothetical protein KWI07_17730 [Enterobacter bugandensis]|uniref:hypothetical protein n=1 Tax=Enterobacter bugandensis TaxID=881260 RepID=UPI0021D0E5A3|nr:hypothetical protein [Enterobacter bugandensis]MCU6162268.1 hypothetical protein [Enterobacter bugandensis]